MDTVAGIVRVHNAGTPPAWQLRALLSLGSGASLGEPAPDEFGRVVAVGLSPTGDVYIADGLNSEIRVFDPDGAFRRRLGREGGGPGEFRALQSIAWVDTTLLALDYGNGRVAEIAPDGTWLGQRPAPGRLSGPATLLRLYAVGPDEVYAWSLTSQPTGVRRVYVRHGPAGVLAETPQVTLADAPPAYVVCHRADGGIQSLEIPYASRFLQHPAPSGQIALAWTGIYQIVLVDAGGDTVRVIEREHQPPPVTDEEWNAALEPWRTFQEEWPGASCEPRGPSRSDRKPAIVDLLIDVTGRFWVETTTPTGTRWEVFDPAGALIATLPAFLRSTSAAPYLGARRLAWVVADSLGVQRVQVAEFGPASSALP